MIRRLLIDPQQAHGVLGSVLREIKPLLGSGQRLELTVKNETRNEDQSAKFHAMCGDLARQCMHVGRKLSKDQWKVLCVSGHAIVTKEGADMVPGLEGEFVNLRESTARMGKKRMASLIDYTQAFGDLAGVQWSEQQMEEA